MQYTLSHTESRRILSFFPSTRGVGYSFFESQDQHYKSGMITTRNRFINERYLERMKKCIDTYKPKVLVLEEYRKSKGSVKKKRIADLIKQIVRYATKQNIQVVLYKRSDIRDVFSFYNVMTKHDIAQLICVWIPELQEKMYQPRSSQRMEPYSAPVFEAVSLCVTYFYLGG